MISVEGATLLEAPSVSPMEHASRWTEAELVAACKAGRKEALDEFVARYYDRVYRLAYTMIGPQAASDLAQETFLAAVKAFPSFRGESQLATWLISILRNQYSLHRRGDRKWKLAPLADEGERLPAPEPGTIQKSVREILDRVKELPEELRMTLVLFYVEGLKYAQIAQVLECPLGTVRSRLFEARERLKKLMEKAEA